MTDHASTLEGPPVSPDIVLEDVCVNNLKHLDVRVRRNTLTVICGVSGSGKSSLAFDTLFAEGQRRYVETFSPYARQFLDQIERPNAARILGIPPAVAIRQNARNQSSRSTVGTRTETLDYLKILFRKAGRIHCPECDAPAVEMTPDAAAEMLIAGHPERRCMLTVSDGGVPTAEWVAEGFVRGIHDQSTQSLEDLTTQQVESFRIVTDRVRIDAASRSRITEAVEAAFAAGRHETVALVQAESGEIVDGQHWAAVRMRRGLGCPACGLPIDQPDASAEITAPVRLDGRTIEDVCRDELNDLVKWFSRTTEVLPSDVAVTLGSTIKQLNLRLNFLADCGLGYLSLDRPLSTLSGGEAQRVVLTSVLGSGLMNSLYVLDEPTAGLHQTDTARIIAATRRLQQTGNTVVVVEHDPEYIMAADDVIEIGPGAGDDGGTLVFQGTPQTLAKAETLTGRSIADLTTADYETPESDTRQPSSWLEFDNVSCHNVHSLSGRIPLNVICAVTGISGSGKSSLVTDALCPAICSHLDDTITLPDDTTVDAVRGIEDFTEAQLLDQTPLPRTRRSVPATLVGVFDDIRKVMAQTHEAKKRNYTASTFSFNSPRGGRCPQCEGHGIVTIEMQFLADIQTTCELCSGRRFRTDVLEIRYRDRSIDEILQMTAEEAFSFFNGQRRIQQPLNALRQAGLGYIRLGQPAATLSGGESQRLRIAALLAGVPLTDEFRATVNRERKKTTGRTLFVLDEPTIGLHLADIQALMTCLNHLVEIGHSVIVIDHSRELLRHADHVIEMGPGAGRHGGRIVSAG